MKSVGQIVCAQGTNVIERNVQMRLFQPCHKQVKRKLLGSYHGMMTTAQRCVLKKLFRLEQTHLHILFNDDRSLGTDNLPN